MRGMAWVRRGAMTLAALFGSTSARAQTATAPAPARSAPLGNLRYEVTFDSITAQSRTIKVAMDFDVAGPGPGPALVPRLDARRVRAGLLRPVGVELRRGGRRASRSTWDKLDYDTWRVQPGGAKSVSVHFDFLADTLDNAMAWARPDFVLFNGTNVLPYPEGRGPTSRPR